MEGLAAQRPFKVSWLNTLLVFEPIIIGLVTPDITGKLETEQVVWDYGNSNGSGVYSWNLVSEISDQIFLSIQVESGDLVGG